MTEKKGKSPYQKYGKQPYRYSDEYHAWAASPSYSTSVRHARRLVRTFGREYWIEKNGNGNYRSILPGEAYEDRTA